MGCTTLLAAVLMLAVPASIAPASPVGAFVVLALLTGGACALVAWRRPDGRTRVWYRRVLGAAAVYAVVVGVIAAVV
ncbi:hypothetical protein [Jatrophihabitans fulvus]